MNPPEPSLTEQLRLEKERADEYQRIAEEFRMELDRIRSVLAAASDLEIRDHVYWYEDCKFFVLCNDVFYWGCADCEDINTQADIDILRKACADSDSETGPLLYCARKRGIRPQGAVYEHLDKKFHALFDECGPSREAQFLNPVARV